MIIAKKIIQGTKEWNDLRAGIPTASAFDKLLTIKGEQSKQRQKYMYGLAAERITGIKEDAYQNAIMQRGLEMEAEARDMYEFIIGSKVKVVGFCYHNKEKLFGCSPDGLVGKDGVLEIKCPTPAIHVGYLLKGTFPIDYFQQIQGQLFITGRKWANFFSYYPGLKPLLLRMMPDKPFMETLKTELEIFCKELDEVTDKLRNA